MKTRLTLLLILCSIVAVAQTKVDTSKIDSAFKHDPKAQGFNPLNIDSLTYGTSTSGQNFAISSITMPKCYKVNWSKVKSFKDLKILLEAMNIQYCLDEKQLKKIKKYLIESK